ncbi:MAG: UDP-N-acetylmuramoyl-L-alanyl-D-glutamate--2,6-diaminopimelate ligase [Candidatus Eisenbacteria bacterium]|nr:UDP-N-acetylmuramoyl-L-alanyl-D-glutamate--2,6-diaminopimelate ligase [Candidatus Eisenbacteria bacterium]
MRLRELLRDLESKTVTGPDDVEVTQIAYDSRKVTPGSLFFSIAGLRSDGLAFFKDALASGAVGVVSDRDVEVAGATRVLVPDVRKALALAACRFHGHPSRRLKTVGITGTNGKTTVSYLVKSVCSEAGLKAGVVGTIGYDLGDVRLKGAYTTPEAPDFQELLAGMLRRGMTHAAVEVSSHALAQRRSYGTEFDVVVFTNLSRDHLDYHNTFEEYRDAKLRLFMKAERGTALKSPVCVLNADDPAHPAFRDAAVASGDPVCMYSLAAAADVSATDVELLPGGSVFLLVWKGKRLKVRLSVPGVFNVMNALAGFGAGVSLGIDPAVVVAGLEALKGVRGRIERVDAGQDFSVFIDYAHTPDALGNILRTVRQLTERELICVFGCGGDRDRGKRSEMGAVSGSLADLTVITSDNPRSEEPLSIIAQIEEGVKRAGGRYAVLPDRREAIRTALAGAGQGDSVVIAGKGHEDYQIVGTEVRHFDDREVAEEFLCARRE